MPLKRLLQIMPDDIKTALEREQLWEAYERRPAYQRNDYLSWISRAKRPETREKRISQMLRELKDGTHYMGMKWPG